MSKGAEVLVKKLIGVPVVPDNDPMNTMTIGELMNLMTVRMYSLLKDGHLRKANFQDKLDQWEAERCGA